MVYGSAISWSKKERTTETGKEEHEQLTAETFGGPKPRWVMTKAEFLKLWRDRQN
jgi:hypothetical protein